jgi:hypothetical protein
MSDVQQTEVKGLTTEDFLSSLKKRVSSHNARLLLHSALVQIGRSGQEVDNSVVLNQDEAQKLCLVLINQGGPAFQVGKTLYKQALQ